MNSLRKRKIKQLSWLCIVVGAVVGMMVFHVMRPSPEERRAGDLRDALLASRDRALTDEERRELRELWRQLPPETRKKVIVEVCRARIEDMRRETANLTGDERRQRVEQALADLRRRRRQATPAEREQWRTRLNDEEVHDMVRHLLTLYQTEFTARERAELDPLVHEWIHQLNWEMR